MSRLYRILKLFNRVMKGIEKGEYTIYFVNILLSVIRMFVELAIIKNE